MNLTRSLYPVLITVFLLCSAVSCGTQTALNTSWSIPQSQEARYQKLVILSVLKAPGESREFENSMVWEFNKSGLVAVSGFSLAKRDPNVSREEMEKLVQASGADGVLICKMIAVNETNRYVPPTAYSVTGTRYPGWWNDPYWGYYHPYPHHYWGQYYTATQVVWTSGYWEHNNAYRVESSLYRASDSKLVWSATSTTYDPKSVSDLAVSLSNSILRQLRTDGFLVR